VRDRVYTVGRDDLRYPAGLLDLTDAPARLWAIGTLDALAPPVVAIVGTRRATVYGERITRELAASLARAGACIVSGMARGIDGVAHVAALEAGGRTAAVLGTGVDVAYPAGHRALHRRIASSGLLLSEMPIGAHCHGGSFLQRNRLIAALAQVIIIVEAPAKSGALKTGGFAEQLNRTVAAVPGPIDSPQSFGCNLLVRDGAQIITSVADALQLAGLTPPARGNTEPDEPDERAVWRALSDGAADLDTLCHRAALPAQRCLVAITALELRGVIECALTGEIHRR
jgi:DNA processing protein